MIQDIVDGGILMGPFLLCVALWIFLTVRYAVRKDRTMKGLCSLLLFPLVFGILAIGQWALNWHYMNTAAQIAAPDPTEYFQDALLISRTTLIILAVAGISLIAAAASFALPCREKRQAEPRR